MTANTLRKYVSLTTTLEKFALTCACLDGMAATSSSTGVVEGTVANVI